tara:strand:+ start:91 stop:498 length:408 start_codon:yes stop_codon:yes gene_type:complete
MENSLLRDVVGLTNMGLTNMELGLTCAIPGHVSESVKPIWTVVMLQMFICGLIVTLVLSNGDFQSKTGKRVIHFGPGTEDVNISAMGVSISSWERWYILIALLVLMEVVQTYTHKHYTRWYRYSVRVSKQKTSKA